MLKSVIDFSISGQNFVLIISPCTTENNYFYLKASGD